jgi:hypothetical protein
MVEMIDKSVDGLSVLRSLVAAAGKNGQPKVAALRKSRGINPRLQKAEQSPLLVCGGRIY